MGCRGFITRAGDPGPAGECFSRKQALHCVCSPVVSMTFVIDFQPQGTRRPVGAARRAEMNVTEPSLRATPPAGMKASPRRETKAHPRARAGGAPMRAQALGPARTPPTSIPPVLLQRAQACPAQLRRRGAAHAARYCQPRRAPRAQSFVATTRVHAHLTAAQRQTRARQQKPHRCQGRALQHAQRDGAPIDRAPLGLPPPIPRGSDRRCAPASGERRRRDARALWRLPSSCRRAPEI